MAKEVSPDATRNPPKWIWAASEAPPAPASEHGRRLSAPGRFAAWLGGAAAAAIAALPSLASADVANNLVSRHYSAVFDDGGPVYGDLDYWPSVPTIPAPRIFSVSITTGAGLTLRGSIFANVSTSTCFDAMKRPICAPGDNLLIYVETGIYGQPGYDRYQFATYFAPNAAHSGILDPRASYAMSCTENGCLVPHIASGVFTVPQGSF